MQRSAKRRKLSNPVEEQIHSLPNGHADSTPSTPSKNQIAGVQPDSPAAAKQPSGTSHSAVYDAWKEAKAKSQARRGRRPNPGTEVPPRRVDVYDDAEGAHAGMSSSFKPKPKPQTSSALTPQKNTLDPLRNQRPSTLAVAPRSAATLGFFKQFHRPKAEAVAIETNGDTGDAQKVNGVSSHGTEETRQSTPRAPEKTTDVDGGASAQSKAKAAKPSWTYAKEPKKTFEDEIRDLADAARERAERGEEDETAATLSRERRSKIHTRTPERGVRTPKKVVKTTSSVKSKPMPQVQKRVQQVDELRNGSLGVAESGTVDGMDLDLGEAGETEPRSASPLATQISGAVTPSKPQRTERMQLASTLDNVSFEPEQLGTIHSILMDKLTGKRPTALKNLAVEYSKVSSLITQTVASGESNSMLLIGTRGSGKSALVNQILSEQAKNHQDDFHVVRLSGFIHTDDKIALREIWRQLGREMEIDEDDAAPKNYADTLTTLLALLSHPAEQGREQQQDQITKSVIFIIDEFELFATHPRQTLLYNLFDIAQSRKAPIAVLGLTTRIDVAESLEKRVKSRFSHRYVHLAMSKSFTTFSDSCKAAISIERDDMTETEREILGSPDDLTQKLAIAKGRKKPAVGTWNALVDELLSQEPFLNHLRQIYHTTKSIPDFHTSMLATASTLPTNEPTTTANLLSHLIETCTTTPSLQPPDSKLAILPSLSTLHIALLICAARLTAIHSIDTVPFAQAYEEYKSLASKAKLQASASGALAQGAASRVWSKDVARDAWEDLVVTGLVVGDGGRGGRVDVGLEEIGMSGVELGSWGRWCRQV